MFEAIYLDSGDPEPEFRASSLCADALWWDWVHDAPSSNHLRFYPKHPGQYLIRATAPEGRQFGVQLTFHALPVHDALPALDGSPENGYASQSGRAEALARRFLRDRPVELFRQNNGEDIATVLTAHLHAASLTNAAALTILAPMVEALPDPVVTDYDLERIVTMLLRLIGLVSFGAPEAEASDRAAALARTVSPRPRQRCATISTP
ncbi:hypothetical protein [Nocardia sp. NBC_01009]|uniref:hypothetical protein n=1 Tax=Nocardia sp. NBC_01009 TaxID=2975996 RepID=UPI00386F6140|nr:hypothetical protein OHA42_17535 [Nocardia sp. NBC_01009]